MAIELWNGGAKMTDRKKVSNITSVFIFVQAIVISVAYLYSRANKWNLQEVFTIFIYPVYSIGIIGIMIVSSILSMIYFSIYLVKMKKIYSCIPILINIIAIVIALTFFNEVQLRENNFINYKDEREYIIHLIENGELQPDDSGKIEIPENLKNSKMERNGYVRFIKYESKIGIYFCTFAGLLETSSGYIYFSDKIESNEFDDENLILLNTYDENWYFCSTY